MLYRHKKLDYTSPAAAQGGPGIQKALSWYFGTPYLNMTAAQWQVAAAGTGLSLGDVWTLGGDARASGGNAFMFVKYSEAAAGLTLGQLVAADDPTAGTATVPGVPVTTAAAVTTNISNVAAGVNGERDNWIFFASAGATLPQLRLIKANTAAASGNFTVSRPDFMRPNSPNDADVLDTVPANTNACCVIRPYNVKINTATTTPIGVALGIVTSLNYTIIQVRGLAIVQTVGNGTAIVVNQPAQGDAAGVAIGTGGTDFLYTGASLVLPQLANVAAGPILTPCYVNFMAQ